VQVSAWELNVETHFVGFIGRGRTKKCLCVWQGKYDGDDAVGEAGMRHNRDDATGQKAEVSRSQDDSI